MRWGMSATNLRHVSGKPTGSSRRFCDRCIFGHGSKSPLNYGSPLDPECWARRVFLLTTQLKSGVGIVKHVCGELVDTEQLWRQYLFSHMKRNVSYLSLVRLLISEVMHQLNTLKMCREILTLVTLRTALRTLAL